MVFGALSNGDHVVLPQFFPEGRKVNATAYVGVLGTIVMTLIEEVTCCNRSVPLHLDHMVPGIDG